jgi:DNA-binding transcriptional ArsR family regulator
MCLDPDRLAAFARLKQGPLGWYLFLSLAAGPSTPVEALAARVGMHPGAARRALAKLARAGAVVPAPDGYQVAPRFREPVKAPGEPVARPAPAAPQSPVPPPAEGPDGPLPPPERMPEEVARYDWVCQQLDRWWPQRDLGIGMARWADYYTSLEVYQAAVEVATWATAPRGCRALLSVLRRNTRDGAPPLDPAEIPVELGGTLARAQTGGSVPSDAGAGRPAGPPAPDRADQVRRALALADRQNQGREAKRAAG